MINKNTISSVLLQCGITFDRLKIDTVNAGAINKNFRVCAISKNRQKGDNLEVDTTQFLVKKFVNNHKLPVDRAQQFALQQQLSLLGLAPKPIYLSDDHTVYIEEWVKAPDGRKHVTIDYLAKLLFQIHSTKLSVNALDLSGDWQQYIFHIVNSSSQVLSSKEMDNICEEYEAMLPLLHAYQKKHQHELVLCHHDLHLSHASGINNICFDWEYAAASSRYFDIACAIKSNDFSSEQADLLLKAYADVSGINAMALKNHTDEAMIFVNFTNKLWWLLTKDTND